MSSRFLCIVPYGMISFIFRANMSWFAYITFCFLKMFILFKNTYITIFNMLFLICRELYKFVFIVQLLSRVQLFATPWAAAHQALLSFTISWSLLKFMSIESFSSCLNCLILCAPFSSCSQYFPASGSFSSDLALHIR